MTDHEAELLNQRIVSVMADIEKIKQAKFCVPDANCGIFVLEDGPHISICGQDLIIGVCQMLNIKIEWDFG